MNSLRLCRLDSDISVMGAHLSVGGTLTCCAASLCTSVRVRLFENPSLAQTRLPKPFSIAARLVREPPVVSIDMRAG